MSNEIQTTVNVSISNGGYVDTFYAKKSIDQSAVGVASGIVSVTTSESNLVLTNVATNGVVCLMNLDTTNYISAGLDDSGTGKFCMKLKPGEPAYFRLLPGINLRVKANTATCKLQYMVLND